MRRIKFYVEAYSEVVEVEDDATEEEIMDDFENWMDGAVESGWYEE